MTKTETPAPSRGALALLRRMAAPMALLLSASTFLSACSPRVPPAPVVSAADVEAYVAPQPPELRRLFAQVPLQGPRNAVLNQMRAGLAALDGGHLGTAAASFDEAIRRIGAVYTETAEADRFRAQRDPGPAQPFLGAPYERAMAHYYRGVIHLMQGEYVAAQAVFRAGLAQDSFMEGNQRMPADFALLAFLDGWAGRCAAAPGGPGFAEAQRLNAQLLEPPAQENLLVLFETGIAPSRLVGGTQNEAMSYTLPLVPPLPGAQLAHAGQLRQAVPAEDIGFQALTRNGRWVNGVRSGELVYGDRAVPGAALVVAPIGILVIGSGRGYRGNPMRGAAGAAGAVAAGVLVAALLIAAAQEAAKREADARHWDNLPAGVLLGSFPPPAAPARRPRGAVAIPAVAVQFARAGTPEQRLLPVHQAGACALAWGREVPAANIPDVAPFSAPPAAAAAPATGAAAAPEPEARPAEAPPRS